MNKFAIGQVASKAKRFVAPGVVGLGLLSLVDSAKAAIDVSAITAGIAEYSGVDSPIVDIGGAILLVVLTIAAIVWVRRALK